MKIRGNLKLVETTQFEKIEGSLWGDSSIYAHSMHQIISTPQTTSPELVAYLLSQYSLKGDIVLDPFCGSGTVPLESNLYGRIAAFSDISPLALLITNAKTDPADITEVTLHLQQCNVRRPINLAHYNEHFKPFFDIDTFREIVNLKIFLRDNPGKITSFVELLGMSLMHGTSAGYFSVYSAPSISLAPEDQNILNIKRSQVPDYRAVMPRILRKAATVLRDGISGSTRSLQTKNIFKQSDARDLSYLASSSVNLTITSVPLPFTPDPFDQMWLRAWFAGTTHRNPSHHEFSTIDGWQDFMNQVLLEIARVTKPGGRACLHLKPVLNGKDLLWTDEYLIDDINHSFGKFWDLECIFINTPKVSMIKTRDRAIKQDSESDRVLVLRRK